MNTAESEVQASNKAEDIPPTQKTRNLDALRALNLSLSGYSEHAEEASALEWILEEYNRLFSNSLLDSLPKKRELRKYVVFQVNGQSDFTLIDAEHFELTSRGDALFYKEGRVSAAITESRIDTIMEHDALDKETLYYWGIETRPALEPKEPNVVDLVETHKVIVDDEIETTSEGWRGVVFDVENDRDEIIGEFDTFSEAVRAVNTFKTKGQKVEKEDIKPDLDGFYPRSYIPKEPYPYLSNGLEVVLKYHDGTLGSGRLEFNGTFHEYVCLFGIKLFERVPKKIIRGWQEAKCDH